MGRPVSVLELTAAEAAELNRRIRGGTTSTRDCLRARIVLLRSRGMKQADVAREVGTSTASVNKWSQRFERQGLDGLVDRSGRGRKAAIAPEVVERVIGKAGSRAPGTRRRSTRTTAAEVGISASSVSRIWRGHGLKPHLRRTFKLSNDPQFEAKFWDIVGLYLDPPEKSIVLCCDEKTQIQALQRTQPGLPLGSGHIRTETHDYHRLFRCQPFRCLMNRWTNHTFTGTGTSTTIGDLQPSTTYEVRVKAANGNGPGGWSGTGSGSTRPNRPPVAGADSATTTAGTAVTIAVLDNDSDPDSDSLTVTAVTNPPRGSAMLNADSTVTYSPDAGRTGEDSFVYTVSDSTATATRLR